MSQRAQQHHERMERYRAVLKAIEDGACTYTEISDRTGIPIRTTSAALAYLSKNKEVERAQNGIYRIPRPRQNVALPRTYVSVEAYVPTDPGYAREGAGDHKKIASLTSFSK